VLSGFCIIHEISNMIVICSRLRFFVSQATQPKTDLSEILESGPITNNFDLAIFMRCLQRELPSLGVNIAERTLRD
jgi:hypothetical protein